MNCGTSGCPNQVGNATPFCDGFWLPDEMYDQTLYFVLYRNKGSNACKPSMTRIGASDCNWDPWTYSPISLNQFPGQDPDTWTGTFSLRRSSCGAQTGIPARIKRDFVRITYPSKQCCNFFFIEISNYRITNPLPTPTWYPTPTPSPSPTPSATPPATPAPPPFIITANKTQITLGDTVTWTISSTVLVKGVVSFAETNVYLPQYKSVNIVNNVGVHTTKYLDYRCFGCSYLPTKTDQTFISHVKHNNVSTYSRDTVIGYDFTGVNSQTINTGYLNTTQVNILTPKTDNRMYKMIGSLESSTGSIANISVRVNGNEVFSAQGISSGCYTGQRSGSFKCYFRVPPQGVVTWSMYNSFCVGSAETAKSSANISVYHQTDEEFASMPK
jgi:hypothetical protein